GFCSETSGNLDHLLSSQQLDTTQDRRLWQEPEGVCGHDYGSSDRDPCVCWPTTYPVRSMDCVARLDMESLFDPGSHSFSAGGKSHRPRRADPRVMNPKPRHVHAQSSSNTSRACGPRSCSGPGAGSK